MEHAGVCYAHEGRTLVPQSAANFQVAIEKLGYDVSLRTTMLRASPRHSVDGLVTTWNTPKRKAPQSRPETWALIGRRAFGGETDQSHRAWGMPNEKLLHQFLWADRGK